MLYKAGNKKNIIFFFLFLFISSLANAEQQSQSSDTHKSLSEILSETFSDYKKLYPDILFLNLQGGDNTLADMVALDLLLGYEPVNLDYEHPPELRQDLYYVSIDKILLMLQYQMPSASLFRADEPVDWQDTICVLTINPNHVAADSNSSTSQLLNLPQEFVEKIPEKLKLQPEDYLQYTINHEIYHCLKSNFVGPQAMSDKTFWAEYSHMSDELGADAFALAMHIKSKRRHDIFIDNIKRIRNMSLYNADPDHFTMKALQRISAIPASHLINMDTPDLFKFSYLLSEHLTISYDDYLIYLASALQAMKAIGVKAKDFDQLTDKLKNIKPDEQQVKMLIEVSQQSLNELKTR